ncbi:Xaa-Pro dipeptidyl-peptidase [Companilactobacillus kedongensis]|uniref:Xaa-Pro dipeptidyl-peptidase n=1 Tax=Companilactobacillus kedongensis TaxID=2486004 RepID=UPI000F7849F3|nr:Xaa-Pro dipeptidyl-peptidase [Companilactobacillus kedongensis]
MRNNQFAIRPTDFDTQIKELKEIRFLNKDNEAETSPSKLLKSFLKLGYPEIKSDQAFAHRLHSLQATEDLDVYDYLENNEQVSVPALYNIALQLLQFNPDVDFTFSDPLEAMKKIQLKVSDHKTDNFDHDEIISAWYWLLATHTKNGQSFIDRLATQGYFVPFYKDTTKQLLFNGKTLPVFDPHKLIREVVYVESSQDTDNDGKLDLLKAEIIRPAQTEKGLKVPVLYTATPYLQGTNDETGLEMTHNVNVPLRHKEPNDTKYEDIEYHTPDEKLPDKRPINGSTTETEEGFIKDLSYSLNDYFLARGFAVVYASGIGTSDSDGMRTTGGPEETTSTIAIIEWLAGNRVAFTNRVDNIEIKAWWSNKSVGMTGRSYLGTLATAAATTGVEGLKTIVTEAAISSWYDYYRDGGLVIAAGGFPGEDADVLAEETFSRRLNPGDFHRIKEAWDEKLIELNHDQDRDTGDYNTYWDARNYHKNFKNIKADVLMVHGLNDWNVKPRNVERLWNGIKNNNIVQKAILHQGQHIYINNFRSIDYTDMINLWMTHELLDVDNQAEKILPDVIIQDNIKPETWDTYDNWSDPENPRKVFNLAPNKLADKPSDTTVSFKDSLPDDQYWAYSKDNDVWQADLLKDDSPLNDNRLVFKTDKLSENMTLDGIPKLDLTVSSNQDLGMLSFQLVDYGKAKRLNVSPSVLTPNGIDETFDWRKDDLREFELGKETSSKMITKGHINLQNRHNPYKSDELIPDKFYDLSVSLQPNFYHLLKDHQLGLIIYATDFGMTVRGNQDLKYSFELENAKLSIPLHKQN